MERKCIHLTLERTDMPDIPGDPPIPADVSIVRDALHIRAERSGTLAADITFEFDLPKDDIKSVTVKFVPDVPDDFEYSPWDQRELSTVTIHHKDPYEVVPEFTTTLSSPKSYWINALLKMLRDKWNVEAMEETKGA